MASPPKSCSPLARRRAHVKVPIPEKREKYVAVISTTTKRRYPERPRFDNTNFLSGRRFFCRENNLDSAGARFSQSRFVPGGAETEISSFPREPIYRLTRACSRLAAQLEIDSWRKASMSSPREIFARPRRRKLECRTFCRNGPRDTQPN